MASPVRFGVITVSDRAFRGEYKDEGGPRAEAYLRKHVSSALDVVMRTVPDEQEQIEAAIASLVDAERCALVVTTGGTGPGPRDVTPEATEAACSRMLPGFGERMRAHSLQYTPLAILSRGSAGIRGEAVVVNLPGKPSAVDECLQVILQPAVHAVRVAGGPRVELAKAETAAIDRLHPDSK